MNARDHRAVRVWRRALVTGGLVLIVFGASTVWSSVPVGQWPSVLIWLAGGVVVHDAVLAPLAVGLGLLVLPRVPAPWRGPLRGGLLAAGALAILGVAVVAGARTRAHWSAVPQDPFAAVATALLVIGAGVALGALVNATRRRRDPAVARRRSGPPPSTPRPR
ncbi:hypothetical protein UQW22_12015 [Isoptericola halotolerans]|uniref:hypothetical protein n=1 Tax=Isoptericola halotolerans TaxID=300560 RepID=UPI00388DBFB6